AVIATTASMLQPGVRCSEMVTVEKPRTSMRRSCAFHAKTGPANRGLATPNRNGCGRLAGDWVCSTVVSVTPFAPLVKARVTLRGKGRAKPRSDGFLTPPALPRYARRAPAPRAPGQIGSRHREPRKRQGNRRREDQAGRRTAARDAVAA